MEPRLDQELIMGLDKEELPPDETLTAVMHRQELSELKMEKLGVRITMVTILIPCLLGALVFYFYLDLKEKLASEETTKTSVVKGITEDFQIKINAMTVDLARISHTIEVKLPEVTSKLKSMEADFAKISTSKADEKEMDKKLAALQKNLKELEAEQKKSRLLLDQSNKKILALLSKNHDQLKDEIGGVSKKIKNETAAQLNKERDIRKKMTSRINDTAETLAILRKDLSLLRIETRTLQGTALLQEDLEKKLKNFAADYDKKLQKLKASLEKKAASSGKPAAVKRSKPKSTPGAESPPPENGILEKDLIQ